MNKNITKGWELKIDVGVIYWEDAIVNGVEDTEGTMIPCRKDDRWQPVINVDTGTIINWEKGKTATINYKVCGDGSYYLYDKETKLIGKRVDDYVIKDLGIDGNGFGDYIFIIVDEEGKIKNWDPKFTEFKLY